MCSWLAGSIALSAAFLIVPAATRAQGARVSHIELYASGGASAVTDKSTLQTQFIVINNQAAIAESAFKTHIHPAGRFSAGFRYWITPRDGFEASYSYAPTNTHGTIVSTLTTATFSSPTLQSFDGLLRSYFYSFNYIRRFRAQSQWEPYLTAGIGGVHWATNFRGFVPPGFNDGFAGNFGVGMDWTLSSHWALQAEYRDYLIEHPRVFNQGAPSGLSHDQAPTVGFVFRF